MNDSRHASSPDKLDPEVSIGLPVFNGEKSIHRTLDSLLNQTFTDFELIISDNASTDSTGQICEYYASRDGRVQYVRQPQNLGSFRNFRYVLQKARGHYFMWAAADDYWYPEFIQKNRNVLLQDPKVVSSISRVRMGKYSNKFSEKVGTSPLCGEYSERLNMYLSWPGANSRFYGLFRRQHLLDAYLDEFFYASDWAVIVNTLRHGEFVEIEEVLMERGHFGESSGKLLSDQLRNLDLRWPKSLFPLYGFTCWLWENISHVDFLMCIAPIIWLNVWFELILLAEIASIRKNIHRVPTFQWPWDSNNK